MQIYGRDLKDILRDLPVPFQIVVAAAAVFIPFVVLYASYQLFVPKTETPVAEPLTILGQGPEVRGVLDPALAQDPKTGAIWLAYTAEEDDGRNDTIFQTHLARSAAGCSAFSRTSGGFDAKADDLLAPDGQSILRTGAWRIETPSLIHDPGDAGREWKLFAYKYFWAKDDPKNALTIAKRYGMVIYKTAADPGGPWSAEQWLFAAKPDYPPPPYQDMILLHLARLDPSLQDAVAFARPSAIVHNGALIMTLSAFTADSTPARVIMILSRDHGQSWVYAGTVLTLADAAPAQKLSGGSLIVNDGKVYFAAVMGDAQQLGRGTRLFEFADVEKAQLKRDAKTGRPAIVRDIPLNGPSGVMGGGFAAFSNACPFGLLTSEQSLGAKNFQIFKTYALPAPKQ